MPEIPWKQWRVHLDITGLLIADQLDLWSPLRPPWSSPVLVSRTLIDAILKLEHDAAHHQISQVKIARAILDAHRDCHLALQADPAGDATTVRHERTAEEDAGAGPTVRSVLAALDATAAPSLGPLDVIPETRARLVFIENTLETVAMEGKLEAILDRFACEVPQEALDAAAETVRNAEARETLADWVGAVKQKMALRLESGRFVFVARRNISLDGSEASEDEVIEGGEDADDSPEDGAAGRHREPDFIEQGLMDLLAAPGGVTSVLWVDDRNLTGYPMAEGKAVAGVVEVLDALRAAERLTDAEHRQKLLQLRAAGAVFLPMRAEEVLLPLLAATHPRRCACGTPMTLSS